MIASAFVPAASCRRPEPGDVCLRRLRGVSATLGPRLQIQFHRAAVRFEGEILQLFFARVTEVPAMDLVVTGFDRIERLDFHHKEHIRDGQNEALINILIRERTEVRHRPDLQSNLFKHFAMKCVFCRFTGIDESAWKSELAFARIFSPDQQQYLSVRICRDCTNRRDGAKEMRMPAGFAVEWILTGLCRWRSAARTEFPCLANRPRAWGGRWFRHTCGFLFCHDVSFRHSAKEARSLERDRASEIKSDRRLQ